MSKRWVSAVEDGWLEVRIDGQANGFLPQGLAVELTSSSGGRDYFEILEGRRKGQTGSVAQDPGECTMWNLWCVLGTPNTTSYLDTTNPLRGGVSLTFDRRSQVLSMGSLSIDTFTQPSNPVPLGTHDLEIPYEPHSRYGRPYVAKGVKYARTWFRIGHSGDRFLHPGTVSEGCITMRAYNEWDSLYATLIKSRKGDGKSVGTVTVRDR